MKKTTLKYGLISGGIVSIGMLIGIPFVNSNTNMDIAQIIGFSTMIIAFSCIFIGVKSYRNNNLNGIISFGQALKLGVFISLIASTMYVLTWMIISDLFFPDFMNDYVNSSIEQLKLSGISEEEIQVGIEEMEAMKIWYKNPLLKALMTYVEILPVGLLMSLVAALVYKKKS